MITPCSTPRGEQDLHANADAENRPPAGQSLADHLIATDPAEPRHAGREGAHARNDQPVRVQRGVTVGGHLGVRTDAGKGALR